MLASTFQQRLAGGETAFVYRWLPRSKPRAVLHLLHGMAEHGGRYARFAQAAVAAGLAVYAQDLPGHGRSVRSPDELGHFDSWAQVLLAINRVRERIEKDHPGLPVFMLGHSMGAFLLQDYLVEHGRGLQGAILSATTGDMGPLRLVGQQLLRAEALWRGRRHRSALAETLSFKDFNRRFRPNRTAFDWLSRDAAEVDAYVADPLCGFRCSCALWLALLGAGATLGDARRLARVPQDLPVLLVAGSADPVTGGEQGPRGLERRYRRAGLIDVQTRFYAEARHELLNETCREQATADVLQWCRDRL